MTSDPAGVERMLQSAERSRGTGFGATGGMMLLRALGIPTPALLFVRSSDEVGAADLSALTGDHVVVKVESDEIPHRSDVGGVAVVPKRADRVAGAIAALEWRLGALPIDGFSINEFVPYEPSLGHEVLVGVRWTDAFGPIVTVGPGGIAAELLANQLQASVAVFAAHPFDRERAAARLASLSWLEPVLGGFRGQRALVSLESTVSIVERFAMLGREAVPERIAELEVNPLVATERGWVALDVLARKGVRRCQERPARPVHKLSSLLTPRRVGVVGVSESINPGRIILTNLLREGFDPASLVVVKPGVADIDGVRAVPSIAEIPGTLDLLVLAVAARHVPAALDECVAREKAESVIIIPGGLEEKAGSEALAGTLQQTIARARRQPGAGPLVNGGNCLGVRSVAGRVDTLFIPTHKLPRGRDVVPLALVSQSGAFAVAKMARLARLDPRFVVTVGNQTDVTVGDYLTYLAADPELRVFGVYVEGFTPLDGRRLLEAARGITASGRSVVLYRAGRTEAGAQASATHTASVGGDYLVCRELAEQAGVLVADTLDRFDELIRIALAFDPRAPGGRRIGAVSNAGFECVAIADGMRTTRLARFSDRTLARLSTICRAARIEGLVDVHNPLDLTPMSDDAAFEEAVRAVLDDEQVDVGLVGCVPLTAALNTLAAGEGHTEDVRDPGSIAARLGRVWRETRKPWVAVVDGGSLYDEMVRVLDEARIPTFRSADRAVAALEIWLRKP